jgi:MFS family permease
VHPTDKEGREEQANASGASTTSSPAVPHDPYQALRYRNFRLLLIGNLVASMGEQMFLVAIGWEIYERTNSALALGLVGLVQVVPAIFLSLPGGDLADRINRKTIMIIALFGLAAGSVGLTALSLTRGPLVLIYGCLLLMGAAAAFYNPASIALVGQTVPENAYTSAATWDSSSWQLASVLGPGLGGLLIAALHSTAPIYLLNAGAALTFALLLIFMRVASQDGERAQHGALRSLLEGITFLGRTQILLAAITLDLFAVLLGGATTLLPIFARDILLVGPTGLGWLRAAPSIGAICITLGLAYLPPFTRAGRTLLLAVAGFGAATIVFGLSRSFWLSLVMLFALGGFDNISVVIRSTLLLTRTPQMMRGRIAAVNSLFIVASNQLGGFESGVTAQFFGPTLSVVAGGIGTILVVLLVAWLWPEMRRMQGLGIEQPSPS